MSSKKIEDLSQRNNGLSRCRSMLLRERTKYPRQRWTGEDVRSFASNAENPATSQKAITPTKERAEKERNRKGEKGEEDGRSTS